MLNRISSFFENVLYLDAADCQTQFIIISAVLAALVLLAVVLFVRRRKKHRESENMTVAEKLTPAETVSPVMVGAEIAQAEGGESKEIEIGSTQHIGARTEQQDVFGVSSDNPAVVAKFGLLAVMADGMGGLSCGAAYAQTAVQTALDSFREETPEKNDEATLLRILKRVREAADEMEQRDGGTTFIAVLIRNRKMHFVSVGDSRIYLLRGNGLLQLNREHIYGRELDELAMNGKMSEWEASHDKQRAALTSYVGKQNEITVDRNICPIPLYPSDKVILMTDGVYNFLPEEDLTRLLSLPPMEAARVVQEAILVRKAPGQDNLSIIILEII